MENQVASGGLLPWMAESSQARKHLQTFVCWSKVGQGDMGWSTKIFPGVPLWASVVLELAQGLSPDLQAQVLSVLICGFL